MQEHGLTGKQQFQNPRQDGVQEFYVDKQMVKEYRAATEQNFAHADAYGPFLQGFKKIVCDCSRSAPVSELVGNVVMSCVRAQALKA